MNTATGLIVAFALIVFGGVGLTIFAITHRKRDANNLDENGLGASPSEMMQRFIIYFLMLLLLFIVLGVFVPMALYAYQRIFGDVPSIVILTKFFSF